MGRRVGWRGGGLVCLHCHVGRVKTVPSCHVPPSPGAALAGGVGGSGVQVVGLCALYTGCDVARTRGACHGPCAFAEAPSNCSSWPATPPSPKRSAGSTGHTHKSGKSLIGWCGHDVGTHSSSDSSGLPVRPCGPFVATHKGFVWCQMQTICPAPSSAETTLGGGGAEGGGGGGGRGQKKRARTHARGAGGVGASGIRLCRGLGMMRAVPLASVQSRKCDVLRIM